MDSTSIQEPSPTSPAMDSGEDKSCIPSGFGRILRDDTGNIIGFEASKIEECPDLEAAEVEVESLQLDTAVDEKWASNRIDSKGKGVLRGELIECVCGLAWAITC